MIKEITGALLLATIQATTIVRYSSYTKNVLLTGMSHTYATYEYDVNDNQTIESANYIQYQTIQGNQSADGINRMQQIILKKQRLLPPEREYITDYYIYTYIENRTEEIGYISRQIKGQIRPYEQNYYLSLSWDIAVTENYPTNQLIINMLNGYTPQTYSELNQACNTSNTGIQNPVWNPLNINNINDLTNVYQIYTGNGFQNTLYIAEHIVIEYDGNEIGNTTQPLIDVVSWPKEETYTINYEYLASTDQEVINIPDIMFTVLGMPFAWFSTAFNFTLFPNTPYAVNISHVLLGIAVACLAIFIIKRILK